MEYCTKRRSRLFAVLLAAVTVLLCACGQGPGKGDDWEAQLALGQKYLLELDYEQAVIAFTKVIEIQGDNWDAYQGRGDAYAGLARSGISAEENFQNARNDYERMISYIEMDWDWVDKVAALYNDMGDLEAVRSLLERAKYSLGTDPRLDALVEKYGLVYDENGYITIPNWERIGQKLIEDSYRLLNYRDDTNYLADYMFDWYLTTEDVEREMRPVAEQLETVREKDPERDLDYAFALTTVYYMLGEWDAYQQTRAYLYRQTGEEKYNPAGYTLTWENGEIKHTCQYNEYGQPVLEYEEGPYGSTKDSPTTYAYDEQGHCIRSEANMDYVYPDIQTYTYVNGQLVHKTRTRATLQYPHCTMHEQYTYEPAYDTEGDFQKFYNVVYTSWWQNDDTGEIFEDLRAEYSGYIHPGGAIILDYGEDTDESE